MKKLLILVVIISTCAYMWKYHREKCERFLCRYRWHQMQKVEVRESEINEMTKYMSRELAEQIWNMEYEKYRKLYK